MLSREAILAVVDLGELVEVPEWGGSVRARGLTVGEWSEVHTIGKEHPERDLMAEFVVRGMIDDNGARILTLEDVPAVAQKDAQAVARVAAVVQRRSGLTQTTKEEREKNS